MRQVGACHTSVRLASSPWCALKASHKAPRLLYGLDAPSSMAPGNCFIAGRSAPMISTSASAAPSTDQKAASSSNATGIA